MNEEIAPPFWVNALMMFVLLFSSEDTRPKTTKALYMAAEHCHSDIVEYGRRRAMWTFGIYILGIAVGIIIQLFLVFVRSIPPRCSLLLKTDQTKKPPRAPLLGRFFLKALVQRDRRVNIIGDAEAEFIDNWKEFGKWGAWFLYWEQVGVECFPTLWRALRWFVWDGALRHLSYFFHKLVG